MNEKTTHTNNATNSADVPPAPPEAHQRAGSIPQGQGDGNIAEIFGEVIHSYTRAQALADGFLVEVSSMAREAGFRFSVALTHAAWVDCVEWMDEDSKRQIHQDESGRLWDVLWMARQAARRGGSSLLFQLYRVPRGGRGVRPRLVTLKMVCGPGDDGEPVITIMEPNED